MCIKLYVYVRNLLRFSSRLVHTVKPEVMAENPEASALLTFSVNLSCVVDGYPEPQVQWLKRNEVLSSEPFAYHLPNEVVKVRVSVKFCSTY